MVQHIKHCTQVVFKCLNSRGCAGYLLVVLYYSQCLYALDDLAISKLSGTLL